jgi:hypothetical protein
MSQLISYNCFVSNVVLFRPVEVLAPMELAILLLV